MGDFDPAFEKLPLFAAFEKKDQLEAVKQACSLEMGGDRRAFVRQGDFTTSFYLLLSGVVSAYRTCADGTRERLFSLGERDWFGEFSRLANQPFRFDLVADHPWTVLVLPPETFNEVYVRDKGFRAMIDERHRKNSLRVQLRFSPLFRRLSTSDLERLQSRVEFRVYDEGDLVAEKGKPAEAVYFVQSGGVARIAVKATNERSVQAFYGVNSSFGERSLSEGGERLWPADHRALNRRTELLVVPREELESAYVDRPETLTQLRTASRLLLAEDEGASTGILGPGRALEESAGGVASSSREQRELLVRKQSFKGGEALVIDLRRCTRCNLCVESCVAVHEDGIPRLSKKGNRLSLDLVLTTSCYNCEIPECMMVCNDGAIRRDHQGLIRFVYDNCIGCTACMAACPYDVIRMTPPEAAPAQASPAGESPGAREGILGFLERVPGLARLLAPKPCPEPAAGVGDGKRKKVSGKAVKCDLCAGLPFEACIYNCPCSAISRVAPDKLWELDEPGVQRVATDGGG